MKSYQIIALLALTLALCLGMLACQDNNTTPEITTPDPPAAEVPVLHYAAKSNVNAEKLQADLHTILNVAEDATITIGGEYDLSVAGKYTLNCTWGEGTKSVLVCVYANSATFTYNGETLTDGTIPMTIFEAQASENFTKGVTVVDSLGNALALEADSRNMPFKGVPGLYMVYHNATDAAGQKFSVRIIYQVEYDNKIVATDSMALTHEASVTVPVDFDGATDVWLEDSKGQKVDVRYYQITADSIIISKDFYAPFLNSRLFLRVCAPSGMDEFTLRVLDQEGYDQLEREKVGALISHQPNYATFESVKGDSVAGADFRYAFRYAKKAGATVDKTALVFKTFGKYGRISFDLYVKSSTNASNNHDMEFQVTSGTKFVSVVDSQGNSIAVVNKNEKPHVVLTQGEKYHIVLDVNNSFRPEFYIWGGRTVEIYYYNFKFDAPEYEYLIDNATQSIVCKKNGEAYGYFAWPTVAKLDGDRLIAVASGFRQAHVNTESKVAVWYSEDGGKTWSEPQVLADTLLDDRDSGVVYWNGKIIVSWFCASKQYYLTTNESKYSEWAAGIDDDYDTKYMGGNYIVSEDGGKTWSKIYNMPDGMFTPHGLIVNPQGGLTSVGYLKYDKVNKTWGTGIGVRTTTGEMDENGFIWSEAIVIATDREQNEKTGWDFQEPYGIYNDDGVLIVVMRANKGLYQCELQPGETEFGEWRKIAFVQETPAHMIEHSSGVMVMTYGYRGLYIDPITGNTVSYTARNEDSSLGIRARLSYDGGLTWTREVVLSHGLYPASNSSDWGYTSTVELSDGKMLTLFYQRTGSETMASIYQIVWELPEAISGEVTLNCFNGLNNLTDDGLIITTVTGQVGEEIKLSTPKKSGYRFDGWYLDWACSIPYVGKTYSQDLTLYAKWVKV